MKKLIAMILALVMALALAACGGAETPDTTPATTAPAVSEPVGATFTVVVVDLDGTETTFTYTSNAATVGEALLAEGLISGEQGDYGLYITSVNGITADWETEGAYWAFSINGEYAQTGVDATEITDGAVYTLTKTVS